jgi:hypothetical protein
MPKTVKEISRFVLKLVGEFYSHEFRCHIRVKFVQ